METKTGYAEKYYAESCSETETAEKNARDYPVSSVARFLFLYQLKKNNDPRFGEVARQTGVYLYNPLWADLQLSQAQMELETETIPELSVIDNKFNGEEVALPVNEEKIENFVSDQEDNVANEIVEPRQAEEELPVEVNEVKNENFISEPEQNLSAESENEVIEPTKTEEELRSEVNEEITENFVSEPERSETSKDIVSEKNEDAVLNEQIVEVPKVEEAKNENIEQKTSIPAEAELNQEKSAISKEANQEIAKDVSASQIKIPAENESEAGEDEDDSISFEPLHTVDYFASQGIRLSEEALNNDQLGKQVKSFTAWLKSMKKLHPGQMPEQNEVIEKLIQTSSEVSNQNANILTEAMAEVLVKQGKREKAIEMYQKLSLINPSKSAYFAAKIESLKSV